MVVSFISRTIMCLHNIRLSYNIQQCYSECACLHKTVNMAVKSYENTYPKGKALFKMYRVVPQTKREN